MKFSGSCVEGRPGGYGGVDIPVPIPNTEVKRSRADGTAVHRGRVGRRRAFFCESSSVVELHLAKVDVAGSSPVSRS